MRKFLRHQPAPINKGTAIPRIDNRPGAIGIQLKSTFMVIKKKGNGIRPKKTIQRIHRLLALAEKVQNKRLLPFFQRFKNEVIHFPIPRKGNLERLSVLIMSVPRQCGGGNPIQIRMTDNMQ